jgi:hypothetical protein
MLSLDMSSLLTQAFDIVNSLFPLVVVIAGLTLGFSIVKGLPKFFKGLF